MMDHMSSKVNRINKKTENRLAPIMNSVLEYAVAFAMIVLCVVLPLYAQDGYYRITQWTTETTDSWDGDDTYQLLSPIS